MICARGVVRRGLIEGRVEREPDVDAESGERLEAARSCGRSRRVAVAKRRAWGGVMGDEGAWERADCARPAFGA